MIITARRFLVVVTLAVVVVAAVSSDLAAQSPGTIAVSGSGKASAVPQYVVIKGRVQGSADTAEEAATEFRKARNRLEKAFAGEDGPRAKLRFEGETSALQAAQAMAVAALGGDVAPTVSGTFTVKEAVELRVDFESNMERMQIAGKLGEIIDAAKAAGVAFDQPVNQLTIAFGGQGTSIVAFMLSDDARAATRQRAYASALKDARARAGELAALAGGKLGKVVSVEEIDQQTSENPYVAMMAWGMRQTGQDDASEYSSSQNAAIEIRRDLRVVFQLLDE